MRLSLFFAILLSSACGFSVVCAAATGNAPSPVVRTALAPKLLATEGTGTAEELLTHASYRTSLLAHEVLRLAGDSAVAGFMAESPESARFLARFFADPEWLRAYLTSGRPIQGTADGLAVLREIWRAEGASPDFANYRELAAAIANQWTVGPNANTLRIKQSLPKFSTQPLTRFRLFRQLDRAGRLHPMFRKLKSWELGFVVGQQWSDSALAWLNEHANLPLERYPDACWAVEYKGTSDFGDTVQGPLYLRPWSDQMNEAQNARLHGSVCGGLSTFGVTAAAAHGIPSYTVGQPGHCAMGIRFARGDWRGGFGGPDGSPHISVWPGNIHFIDLMEAVFGDDAGLEQALLWQARSHLLRDAGRADAADAALAAAVKASPMHLDLRREEIARMKENNPSPQQWASYADSLLREFGKHTHPAVDLCREIEPQFLTALDDTARVAWFAKLHQAAARATESWAWDVAEQLLVPQAKQLTTAAAREGLLREAMAAHLGGSGSSFGKVLEWGVKNLVERGEGDAFGRAFAAAVAAAPHAKPDPKKMKEAYGKAILATEAARSAPAFQALSKTAAPLAPAAPAPLKLDLPPGKIVSQNAIIYASSSAWDEPLAHRGVLSESGGTIHTKDEATPSITVEVPGGVANLGGVLLVKTDGNQHRLKRVKISRSTDGATWFPLAESADMPRQWKIEAPPGTAARWFKFEALNEKPEFCHLRNFIITAP